MKYTKHVISVTNNGLKTMWKGFTKAAKSAQTALHSLVQKRTDEGNETGIVNTPSEDVLSAEKKPEVAESSGEAK